VATLKRKRAKDLPVEPKIAAAYKLNAWLDKNFEQCESEQDLWELLGAVRVMVGQKPRQMDGVNYTEMRDFNETFTGEWKIGNS
jgi:hypothetical protein